MRAGPFIAGGAVLLGAIALASKSSAAEPTKSTGALGSFWDNFANAFPPAPPPPASVPLPPLSSFVQANLIPVARNAARARGIPEDGFVKQMWVESHFDPRAYNHGSGACGIGQFIVAAGLDYGLVTAPSATDKEYRRRWNDRSYNKRDVDRWLLAQPGVKDNRTNATKNIKAAAKYMQVLYKRYDSWAVAAAAYNRGPGNVNQWLQGNQTLPSETVNYASYVAPWYGPLPVA
jgi:soluble lytic murein transglycosylase-like protein